MTYRPHH